VTRALVRMRLTAFVRTGRALPSLLACLVVLGVIYGGGKAQAGEAYGFSAVALFPVLAWQVKLVLDTEPDVQRRLALATVGPRREITAGLLAATVAGAATVALALVVPWLVGALAIGGIEGPRQPGDLPLAAGLALGLWAHVAALIAAVGLGALASRPVTRSTLYGVAVLATGSVLAIVLGLRGSVAPWLVPPLMAAARDLARRPDGPDIVSLSAQAATWTAVVVAIYARLRRTRR
jgi:hypothetical protein